jgi:hypothetical protein
MNHQGSTDPLQPGSEQPSRPSGAQSRKPQSEARKKFKKASLRLGRGGSRRILLTLLKKIKN